MRYSKLYRSLWGLTRNPFPDHAIASAGDEHQPFYDNLHPGIAAKMARAFFGSTGARPVAFLWSLGEGEEARGYGKTRHLLWFANCVNADFGHSVAKLAGQQSHHSSVAAYAAYNSAEGLSLSNLLFDLVRDLVGARRDTLIRSREAAFKNGKTPADLFGSAEYALHQTGEWWHAGLLYTLCYRDPIDWIEYLDNPYRFSQWHKVRYGSRLLRSSVAFLLELEIQRFVMLVDQLEDFASFSTPSYKLKRDFPRLASLSALESIFRQRLTFVLTMHPRAARIVSYYWPNQALGPLGVDGAENVLQLGPMISARFKELVKTYLDAARVHGPTHSLTPFTEDTIDLVHKAEHGRPGYCLQRLHFLLDFAALEGIQTIERQFAERFIARPWRSAWEA